MSARSVLGALPAQFEVTAVVIDKKGQWLGLQESAQALGWPQVSYQDHPAAPLESAQHELRLERTGPAQAIQGYARAIQGYDVVFPLLHGPHGEDGTVQGLLTLAGVPFVGSGVLGSAASMDKAVTKELLQAVGIPQTPYRLLVRREWQDNPASAQAQADALGYPLFVKPANMGSSVGISRVKSAGELPRALNLAFAHDRRVLLDKATTHKPRELEVGILGNDRPQASVVGELSFEAEFYDYETKYTEGRTTMHIPARVSSEVSAKIRQYALSAFAALDCAGLARIDFFYVDQTNELFLNEVNTMPGFTSTSMYPKLWEAAGLAYPDLLTRLLELAQEER